MVWKHLKKPAILVASLALAVGIAPMVAFAADDDAAVDQDNPELAAQALSTIDSVSVTVTPPTPGGTTATDPTVTVPSDANYASEGSFWSVDESGSKYGAGDNPNVTFEDGKDYLIYVMLNASDGFQFKDGITPNVSGGTYVSTGELMDNMFHFTVSVKAAAAQDPEQKDEPAADEPESTDPAAPEPTPAAADDETAASTDTATTTTSSSTASTLPKTGDTLPIALFGTMALMSALALALTWRLRKN